VNGKQTKLLFGVNGSFSQFWFWATASKGKLLLQAEGARGRVLKLFGSYYKMKESSS